MAKGKKNIVTQIKDLYTGGKLTEAVDLYLNFFNTPDFKDENEKQEVMQEIIAMTTLWLDKKITAEAYIIRGVSHHELNEYDKAIEDLTKAIELDPKNENTYFNRGLSYDKLGKDDKAVEDFTKVIEIDPHQHAYNNRGKAYLTLDQYNLAIEDFTKAIEINPEDEYYYRNRGFAYRNLKQYEKAIDDFTTAIKIAPKYPSAYFSRAFTYDILKEYDKALKDYKKVIELNSKNADAYNNIAVIYRALGENDKAIENYKKAIEVNPKVQNAHKNLGNVLKELKLYDQAIENYKHFITHSSDNKSYSVEKAREEIKDLERRKEEEDYQVIGKLVDDIKKLLRFDGLPLTHYTSLSTAKALIINKSQFRLSEGAYLNDTSEGKELYNYLCLEIEQRSNKKDAPEVFINKPFIGSFVPATKHDDLTLWRMYGKEAQVEARGCAITIDSTEFLNSLRSKMIRPENNSKSLQDNTDDFAFFQVAYKTGEENERFIIPGNKEKEDDLNKLMKELKQNIKRLETDSKEKLYQWVRNKLTEIIYLFKTDEYQNENEVRLVISGIGFEKNINSDRIPPGVYIELVSIINLIRKVTLGPKVERADEWAAAFHYTMHKEENISEILISHLPYK
ncbi:MAG TPA: tetratricopeptide repeat protein [Bacteroidia bacterium]|nr:tetratricopeptide repeat protein [Bacteroidia bacterium]